MYIKTTFFSLIVTYSLVSLGNDTQTLPDFAVDLLKKHSCWQTSAFMSLGTSKLPLIGKKWTTINDGNSFYLNEATQLTLNNEGVWTSGQIRLPKTPTINDLTNSPFNGNFKFTQRKNDQLLATVNVGFELQVLFLPSSCKNKIDQHYQGDIGVGEIPFGLTAPPVPYTNSQPKYIHHPYNAKVIVRLDLSFPTQFIHIAEKAIKKWNTAIGWNVYSLDPLLSKLDSLDCISSNMLCFFWEGKTDNFGWIGWGGLTSMSFDPQTGEIQGAAISLQNLSPGNLKPTPENILQQIITNFDLDLVSSILLRKEEFKHYSHAFPSEIMEHVILHEMGHANGFKHDFKGSLMGTALYPSESIMEYLPFVVSHKLNYIGIKDIQRLNVIYRRTAHQKSLATCSDIEAKIGNDPNCLQNDLGEPTQWYIRLSETGENGIYTVVRENQSGLPERPYLNILGKFLSNSLVHPLQQQRVINYLCSLPNRNKINDYLASMQKTLKCPYLPF